jgi:hypothetical protein
LSFSLPFKIKVQKEWSRQVTVVTQMKYTRSKIACGNKWLNQKIIKVGILEIQHLGRENIKNNRLAVNR